MASLDYRKEHGAKLVEMQGKLEGLRTMLPNLPEIEQEAQGKETYLEFLDGLSKRIEQRLSRVRESTCRVAVIGLEKAGKSTFINAWIGGQALPADRERCTWAASTIRNGSRIQAEIVFSTREEFDADVNKLYQDAGLDRGKFPFPLSEDASANPELPPKITNHNEYKDIEDLSRFWSEINPQLGRGKLIVTANSVAELRTKIFPYISRLEEGGKKIGTAYAVKQVNIDIPLEDNLEFTIDDLPGVNAPGNRAEEMTFRSLRETADVIVFIKNAASNASPDRDETRIWKEADESDTSMPLTGRLFVIMSRADEHAVDNGRDAHEQGAKAFQDKGVSGAHIFYCSSTAELYRLYQKDGGEEPSFIKNPDGSAAYSDRTCEEAGKKIASYLKTAEPTSGIPEFKRALYDFLKDDFPVLEQSALEKLNAEFAKSMETARELITAYSNASSSEANATTEEQQRFEKLWQPSDLQQKDKGLSRAILRAVNGQIREVMEPSETSEEFMKGIRANITGSKERFLETITVDAFNAFDLTQQATALKTISAMKAGYFEKIQGALKDEIYDSLALDISHNITGNLQPIWDKAMGAQTPESAQGLGVIPVIERNEFLGKKLKNKPNSALAQLFLSGNEKDLTVSSAGFAALLKSIVHAPAEYLLNPDDIYDTDRARLLQKANLYQTGICDEKTKKRLASQYEKYGEEIKKDKNSGLIEMIKDDTALFRDVLDLFLPRSFVTLASLALKAAEKAAKAVKENPFADTKSSADDSQDAPQPEMTAESIVEDLKKRVEVFYFILEAMLFDRDFGFIGYYRAYLEEFRRAVESEMNPGGAIKSLAFKFRERVWPNEGEFKTNGERQRREQLLARLRQITGC
jgi:GTPase SAR1 family protein